MSTPDDIKDTMRQQLDNLMRDTDIVQSTDKIRELKHSASIRGDLDRLVALRRQHGRASAETFRRMALARCAFMHEHYADILFKLIKQEADIRLVYKFVDLLSAIEQGQLNQHEASFQVGTMLKKMHIDSVLRRDAAREEAEGRKKKGKGRKGPKKLSYQQWVDRGSA